MKKVLVISYYFPPGGGSAVQRVLKFVKYLPQYGWEPVVLTAREKDYALRDNSLLTEIPENVKVYRTSAPDLYQLYGRLGSSEKKSKTDLSAMAVGKTGKGNWLERLALLIRSSLFVPDARIGWLPFALRNGKKIIQEEKIKVIFTSSPPFTTALIGGLLKTVTHLPWISDYRDPWTQAYFYFQRPLVSKRVEEFLEKCLLKKTDKIVSINERILQALGKKYGYWQKKKWAIIPNGYDPDDFEGIEPIKYPFFTITYTGTINTKMNPGSLLKAVRELNQMYPEFGRKTRLNFIGRIGNDVISMFNDPELKKNIKLIAHLPHRECLRYTMGANLLLLLIPESQNSALIMTGKLFEYLSSGNPILCLSDHGDAASLIQKTGAGFTIPSWDIEKIKKILIECFQRWKMGGKLLPKPILQSEVEKFDRKKTTRMLSLVLDEIIE